MHSAMQGLAAALNRYRWVVIAAGLVGLAVALPIARHQSDHLSVAAFDVPGSQSDSVADAIERDFTERTHGIGVVLQASPGATPRQLAGAVRRLRRDVAAVDHLSLPSGGVASARAQLKRDGLALVPLRSDEPPSQLNDPAVDLRDEVRPGISAGGVTPYLVGDPAAIAGLQELSKEDLRQAEVIGFPIVAVVLFVVFGSLAAAALPMVLAFISVTITGAVIYLISLHMTTSVYVTNMASLIGIGVAVDYSLFILARFREETRAGRPLDEARAAALATSGLAVVFSGVAVIISLAGLWMVHNQAIRSMALGAMVVVAISILAAVTLLPALMTVLGSRVEATGAGARGIRFLRDGLRRVLRPGKPRRGSFGERWANRVISRPWLSLLTVGAVMLTLAMPTLWMKTGAGQMSQFPRDHDVRVGSDLASKIVGGSTDRLLIVAAFHHGSLGDPGNRIAVEEFRRDLRREQELRAVSGPVPGDRNVLIEATARRSSDATPTLRLVGELRNQTLPGSELARRATVSVGGAAAGITDFRNQVNGSMWRIIAFILGFSFVVLMLMLRSLLLPVKAILMNLLSLGATYGVLVAVFQWGWLDGFLGFQSLGAINTLNPPLILAVVFGLSMDYEIFLLSRIRERYLLHGDNSRAIAEGLASSAGTISSAALIMTAVFSVFVLTGVPTIKEIGLGLAIAIALDATLVRLILVPAAMQLMGRWNWWLPAWLDRMLPRLGAEKGSVR